MKLFTISYFIVVLLFVFNINQDNKLKESIKRGSELFSDFCITCHMPSGEGVANIYPPLAKSDFLIKKREESIRAIKYGINGEIMVNGTSYNSIMEPLGLSDDEVADIMNYITNSWGNKNEKMITIEEVSNIKK